MEEVKFKKDNFLLSIFAFVIIACFVSGYWPIFQKFGLYWSKGDNNYCYLIVPLFFYLCWEKRSIFRFFEFSWNAWGIVPLVFSAGLIIIGELGSVITLYFIGIWGIFIGLALVFYGKRIRSLIFPLLTLFFIVPLPPLINRLLTFELRVAATSLSVAMFRLFDISVLQEGNIIDLGVTRLQVVDACSGLRYMMPLILLSLLIGHFFSKRWWKRMVLLLLVVPISISLNAIRIFISGSLIINGHAELAENLFHDFTGWLVFMIAGGLLYLTTLVLKKIGKNHTSKPKTDSGGHKTGMKRPIILTVAICIMFVSTGWALKQMASADNLPQHLSFESFPMNIGKWEGTRSYYSKQIMDRVWADDYVSATFINVNHPNMIYLFIPFYEYQATRHTAHAPQACLLGGGYALLKSEERNVNINREKDFKIMTLTLENGTSKVLGSYFFLQRGRVITSPWMNKFYLMWDSFTRQRTDGALVRAEMVLAPGQSVEDGWVVLEDFIAKLWPILPDYIPL